VTALVLAFLAGLVCGAVLTSLLVSARFTLYRRNRLP
jgi:uncharacterized integral membrane protein